MLIELLIAVVILAIIGAIIYYAPMPPTYKQGVSCIVLLCVVLWIVLALSGEAPRLR